MIRKNTNGDISEAEFEAILKPFIDDYDNFVISYIMPEVIAYYIANSYYRGSMYEGSFLQHYNSAKDLINMFGENEEKVKAEVFKLLRVKYAISITNENPLEIKKITPLQSTIIVQDAYKDEFYYWDYNTHEMCSYNCETNQSSVFRSGGTAGQYHFPGNQRGLS